MQALPQIEFRDFGHQVDPPRCSQRPRKEPFPALRDMGLERLRIDRLRAALRANRISFPNPVPTFEKHDRPDVQWRAAQLYFVLGWDCNRIGGRFCLSHQRVRQILAAWKRRALEMGYIQDILPLKM
jgi:hypothetical protein